MNYELISAIGVPLILLVGGYFLSQHTATAGIIRDNTETIISLSKQLQAERESRRAAEDELEAAEDRYESLARSMDVLKEAIHGESRPDVEEG